jgi:NAD(P)-dependent dehydrogenase (short-subunit alcohol dehydrogenase family)
MTRSALVTGCSSGIGYTIAQALLDDGWAVLGASRTRPLLHHQRFRWAQTDVASGESVRALGQHLASAPLDALIHCAAVRGEIGPIEQTDPTAWIETIQTNLIGAYHVVSAMLPHLQRSSDGRVLLFAGGGAFEPHANFSAYACAKAAVVRLAETLALELAGTSVAVNCVAPGFIVTPIHQATLEAGPDLAGPEYQQVLDGLAADDGSRLACAVACVRHLLSPATLGLSGKTIAAQFDDWARLGPATVSEVMATEIWSGRRVNAEAWERPERCRHVSSETADDAASAAALRSYADVGANPPDADGRGPDEIEPDGLAVCGRCGANGTR